MPCRLTALCLQSSVRVRVGIHAGPLASGLMGRLRPRFCLFGVCTLGVGKNIFFLSSHAPS